MTVYGIDQPSQATGNEAIPASPPKLMLAAVLIAVQLVLSILLCMGAYLGQMEFGACGYVSLAAECNFGLGTGGLYAFVAVAVVLLAISIARVAGSPRKVQASWKAPLFGMAILVFAFLGYLVLMYFATH